LSSEHRLAQVQELRLATRALRRGIAGGTRALELGLELRDLRSSSPILRSARRS